MTSKIFKASARKIVKGRAGGAISRCKKITSVLPATAATVMEVSLP